jgi:alpha-beta hydrolase superfamily lysophospholipase
MMQKELYWKSKEGNRIFASVWEPDSKVNAVITLVHGFGEHCLRYAPYAAHFVAANIAFVGFDLYGHGQSDGKKGTLISYESMLDEVELALNETALLFPGKPIFLYGHSMGGNIALNYLLRRDPKVAGGIVTSPWLSLFKEPNSMVKGLVGLLKRVLPNTTIDSGLEIKYISKDAAEVEKYRTDPLNHGRISFLLFHEITQNGKWAVSNASKLSIPLLLMHGTDDRITSIAASKRMASECSKFIEFIEWDRGYHELHNDFMRLALAEKVIQWIQAKK